MASVLYLFDIDGTLLLTGGAGSVALNAVFERRFGLSGAMDHVRAGGKTDPGIVGEIFDTRMDRSPEPGEIDSILDEYVPLLRQALHDSARFRLMPSVIETLDFLAAQAEVCLAIATGNIQRGARAKLDRAGLADRFVLGGYGDDSAVRAELVQRGIERGQDQAGVEFDLDRIVVVGDTTRDIDAARACGVRVLAVATGFVTTQTLAAQRPDAVFDTLAELPAWHKRAYS